MSSRSKYVKAYNRNSRSHYRTQHHQFRQLPPSKIMEYLDTEELHQRYPDPIETRKPRKRRRPQSQELGDDTESPEE